MRVPETSVYTGPEPEERATTNDRPSSTTTIPARITAPATMPAGCWGRPRRARPQRTDHTIAAPRATRPTTRLPNRRGSSTGPAPTKPPTPLVMAPSTATASQARTTHQAGISSGRNSVTPCHQRWPVTRSAASVTARPNASPGRYAAPAGGA